MLYDVLLCFFLTLSPPSLSQMAFVSACAALPRGGESFDLLQCSGHGSVFYLRGLYGTCDMQIRGSSILNHNQVEAPFCRLLGSPWTERPQAPVYGIMVKARFAVLFNQ